MRSSLHGPYELGYTSPRNGSGGGWGEGAGGGEIVGDLRHASDQSPNLDHNIHPGAKTNTRIS